MTNVEKIAKLASEWWTNQIKNPIFDNGDDSGNGLFAAGLASLAVKKISDKQADNFKEDLYDLIIKKLNEQSSYKDGLEYFYEYRSYIELSTDYSPSTTLKQIAERNNISLNNFPWKTTMWISRNHLQVRGGYSAQNEMLFATKRYYNNRIKQYKREILEIKQEDDNKWNEIHSFSKQDILEDYKKILDDLYLQLAQAYPVKKEAMNDSSN